MVRQAGNIPSDLAKCVRDRTANRGMPSIYEKQVYDGTAGSKCAFKSGKLSLRWYDGTDVYRQIRKSKLGMARQPGRLPSNQEKQVRNGTTARTLAVKSEKASWEWHDSPDVCRQTGNGSSCDRAVPCIPILAPHSHFRASFTFPRCFAAPAVYAHI